MCDLGSTYTGLGKNSFSLGNEAEWFKGKAVAQQEGSTGTDVELSEPDLGAQQTTTPCETAATGRGERGRKLQAALMSQMEQNSVSPTSKARNDCLGHS